MSIPLDGDDDGIKGYGVRGTSSNVGGLGVEGKSSLGDGVTGITAYVSAVGLHGINKSHGRTSQNRQSERSSVLQSCRRSYHLDLIYTRGCAG